MANDGRMDEAKGRVKEAAGDLTGDDDLKSEGKVDRASGTVKGKVGQAADKVKGLFNRHNSRAPAGSPSGISPQHRPAAPPSAVSRPAPRRSRQRTAGSWANSAWSSSVSLG